ncbi:hypothetical protein Apa02nite_069870 [Actinoplanes palleronii]|uniref:Uncharacterized protein n=1 Tax=Actinoplanes palleronii TaxID=113570 RepID=A0ABQ4BJM9_9ACTN|nr:hypothetical protein Apa02nite_069870 [Actinoplanes palleronii]
MFTMCLTRDTIGGPVTRMSICVGFVADGYRHDTRTGPGEPAGQAAAGRRLPP